MARQKKKKEEKKKSMKIASNLKQVAPGVLASPGAMKDPAMKAVIDKLTKELTTEFSPETIKWIKALQKMPQFDGDPRLVKVLTRKKRAFESKLALEKKLANKRERLSIKR